MNNLSLNSPQQITENMIQAGVAKTSTPLVKMILLGIFAGMFIACGASASSVAMHAMTNVGLQRLVGGCIFPIGLMMIVLVCCTCNAGRVGIFTDPICNHSRC